MWFHSFVKTKKSINCDPPAAHKTISYYFFGFKKNLKHNGPWWARARLVTRTPARARVKRARFCMNVIFVLNFWFFVFSFLFFFFLLNAVMNQTKTLEKTQNENSFFVFIAAADNGVYECPATIYCKCMNDLRACAWLRARGTRT